MKPLTITVLGVILYGCGTWSVNLKERRGLMILENKTFRGESEEYLCVDKTQLTPEIIHKIDVRFYNFDQLADVGFHSKGSHKRGKID